jgi:diguanylate cyclase (GGDEF)-like protein/PAS domain S-box-containing protein
MLVNLQWLLGALPTPYLVLTPDLVIAEANTAYLDLLGRTRSDLVGRPVFDVFPPTADALDDQGRNLVRDSLERVRDTGELDVVPVSRFDVVDPATGRLAERHWCVVNAAVPGDDGPTSLLLQCAADVTSLVRGRANRRGSAAREHARIRHLDGLRADLRLRLQQLSAARECGDVISTALQASEDRARAVLDSTVDAIITIDGSGRVASVNRATEQMFGYPEEEVVGRNIRMLMPEPYRGQHDGHLERYQRTGEKRIIGSGREVSGLHRDGHTFPIELAVSEVGSDRQLFTGVLRDITGRKRLETQLIHQSLHDPLTGLANRALLVERIELATARLGRHPGLMTLLFVDLDHFKRVNDNLGHEAGDELLKRTAARLRAGVRPEDLVARLGGDEFVVLCEDLADDAGAHALASRLVQTLNTPMSLRGREIEVSASVGVVTERGKRSAADLLRDADAAMYRAKQDGRGRYKMTDEAARAMTSNRLQVGWDLQRALPNNQMRAVYQPVIDLHTGGVVAAEALVRWQHPERGLLAPAAFLDIAAELGSITDLDAWMLVNACLEAADWGRQGFGPVGVCVNISSRSLVDGRLLERVGKALEVSHLDPRLLTLELAESSLMQDAPAAGRTLTDLRALGVQMSVDDFGTGYSSLRYLQQFPVHFLKVDCSFVAGLDDSGSVAADSAGIIQAIVNLAVALDLQTVAEGVETPGQLAGVTALGCDLGQGFFLGRPAPRQDITAALREGVVLTPAARNKFVPKMRLAVS